MKIFAVVCLPLLVALASPASAQSFPGTYSVGKSGARWDATIAQKTATTFGIKLSVASRRPACSGELETTGEIKGETIVTLSPEKGDECKVTISRSGGGITISEESCMMWHGASCEFSGKLARKK